MGEWSPSRPKIKGGWWFYHSMVVPIPKGCHRVNETCESIDYGGPPLKYHEVQTSQEVKTQIILRYSNSEISPIYKMILYTTKLSHKHHNPAHNHCKTILFEAASNLLPLHCTLGAVIGRRPRAFWGSHGPPVPTHLH